MDKKKLAQVITLSEFGGAGKVLISIINNLPTDEFEITIISGQGNEFTKWLNADIRHKIRHIQIPSLVRTINPVKDLLALITLFLHFRKEKYDIVHCHSSKAGVLGRIAAWYAGVKKIVFTVHGWGINDYQKKLIRYIYISLEKIAAKCCHKIVCVSENDKFIGFKYNIASSDKIKVIYNGIEGFDDVKTGKLRKELSATNNDKFFGMVARFSFQKSPLLFIQVAENIISKRQDLKFVLIGDGPDFSACEEYIRNKNLNENIFLLGNRLNVKELLPDLDVFVLLSKWEGLPLSIIEAMFCGLPIIASDVGGNRELIEDGVNGFLVNHDINYISDKIIHLYDNAELMKSIGKNNKEKAHKMFNIKSMVGNYIKVYIEGS